MISYYPFIFILYAMSIIGFAVMAFDKLLAIRNKRNIPMWAEICISVLGGAFGILFGIAFFNADARRIKTLPVVAAVMLIIQIMIIFIYRGFCI